MKQLPISGRQWVFVMLASIVVMVGAVYVVKQNRAQQDAAPPLDTLTTQADDRELSLNDLDSEPPPMPGPTGGGESDGGRGALPTESAQGGVETMLVTTGGDTETSEPFDVPADPVEQLPPVAQQQEPRMITVWVTEEDAQAYSQPGFNMPVARELEQWEELRILDSNKEKNWDRVQDLQGQQFWVQKKIVTTIRPQNLSQPSIAEKKVMDFYTQVAHQEHSDAYVHLSPEWKRELSFDRFVKGYSRTDSLRSEIVNVLEIGEDRFQVDVAMEAIEEGQPVDYLGIYTVEKVDGKWYLTSGSLNRQGRGF